MSNCKFEQLHEQRPTCSMSSVLVSNVPPFSLSFTLRCKQLDEDLKIQIDAKQTQKLAHDARQRKISEEKVGWGEVLTGLSRWPSGSAFFSFWEGGLSGELNFSHQTQQRAKLNNGSPLPTVRILSVTKQGALGSLKDTIPCQHLALCSQTDNETQCPKTVFPSHVCKMANCEGTPACGTYVNAPRLCLQFDAENEVSRLRDTCEKLQRKIQAYSLCKVGTFGRGHPHLMACHVCHASRTPCCATLCRTCAMLCYTGGAAPCCAVLCCAELGCGVSCGCRVVAGRLLWLICRSCWGLR